MAAVLCQPRTIPDWGKMNNHGSKLETAKRVYVSPVHGPELETAKRFGYKPE
jgi:hypothetical protein